MASAITFDTHAYVKAEAQAETLVTLIEDRLATKQDLYELERSLKRDLKELEMRLLIRMGGLMVLAVTLVSALVKLL